MSRAGWAREVFRPVDVDVETAEVPSGEPMRPWQQALAHYVPLLVPRR